MTLLWLPEAKQDVQRLFDFLFPHNPKAAARAVQTIARGAKQLEEFGDIGRPMDDDTGRRELFASVPAIMFCVI